MLRRGAVPPPTGTAALPGASPDLEKLYTWAGYEYEPAGAPRLPAPDPAWERQWLAAVKAVEATPALQAGLVEAVTGRLQALGLTADPALARTALGGVLAGAAPTISKTDFFTDEDGTVHPIRGSDGYEDSGGGGGGKDGKENGDGGSSGGTTGTPSPGERVVAPLDVPTFKTVAEAETWMRDSFGMKATLTGIAKEHLVPIGESLAKIHADFPELVADLNLHMATASDAHPRGAFAFAYRGRTEVVLANAYFKSGPTTLAKFNHAVDGSRKSGWLQPGTHDAGAVIAHEIGHVADFQIERHGLAGDFRTDFIKPFTGPGGRAREMGQVSKYAATSPRVEGFAETFANHYYPERGGTEKPIAADLHTWIKGTGVFS